ncbi:hypothetical protein CUMW_006560 [Citrus unshiu]|nr:hypothetical protein CUMW_006560 [Citrus unshiu]
MRINFKPSDAHTLSVFSSLSHLNFTSNVLTSYVALALCHCLFINIVRILLVDGQRCSVQLALHQVVGTLPRVLASASLLGRRLTDP